MKPSFSEFEQMAGRGNLIPVFQDLSADGLSPTRVYEGLKDSSYSYLLESADEERKWGRYSIIGFQPLIVALLYDQRMKILRDDLLTTMENVEDPLPALRDLLKAFRPVRNPNLPPFQGGLVGYFNYDLVRKWERLPGVSSQEGGLPEGIFTASRQMIVFDHLASKISVVVLAHLEPGRSHEETYDEACDRVARCVKEIEEPLGKEGSSSSFSATSLQSNFKREDFTAAVRKAKEHIVAGDVIQVVVSQRFSGEGSGEPFSLYRRLRSINPSPYLFYLNYGETTLIGSSPEILVRLTDGKILVCPIAGTRPRGENPAQDRALEEELLADPKERAEHIMLVDLGRNDVGKVSMPGSVRVFPLMKVERYSHVMHIVSGVEGQLKTGLDCFDVFKSAFPAGTLTGAPKIRAMEIISELEPGPRGPYGGAVGYFGFDGNMDFCITIRTITVQQDKVSVQAGAGIVFDSSPELEHQECLNKAKALFEAIEGARSYDPFDR